MSDNDKAYLAAYIQKLEVHFMDVMRRSIDSDLKINSLINNIKQVELQYEESQKQVELQNQMMEQAATSIRLLTEDKQQLDQNLITLKEEHNINSQTLNDIISVKNKQIDQLSDENKKINQENQNNLKQLKDLQNEIDRQNGELSLMLVKPVKKK